MKYVFFLSEEDYFPVMFRDLYSKEGCYIIAAKFLPDLTSTFLKLVRKIHVSRKLQKILHFSLPLQSIWFPRFPQLDSREEKTAVFIHPFLGAYDDGFIRFLRKKYNFKKFVLFLTDPYEKANSVPSLDKMKENYDLILSVDYNDCKKYGFIYRENCYSKVVYEEKKEFYSDIFFIGNAKGRLDLLHEIYRICVDSGLHPVFYIVGVPDEEQIYPGIFYNKRLPYPVAAEYAANTKILLEVLQEGQSGLTLRTQEALTYGKKLLTNNFLIKELACYDPCNIHVFSLPDRIDKRFLTECGKCHYENIPAFSADKFLGFIQNNIDNMKI